MKDCARLLDAQAGRDLLAGSPGSGMVVPLTGAPDPKTIANGKGEHPVG
ncbi:hypothetical protein [Actinoplanes sp. OR16]|nr:hypothetical protein [Actinoplanes sp. OR16]